ncbi:deoxyribonuclease IV [Pediococcus ethanolidurans]|uniref:deoxyribonuclease IV n=1 Tax=Pediococcus ethanolidurans TaxID=319653 RepID=UPI0029552E46|nr:deoxyribonuclease IV [Pediococcus ethanolidurans]MDV7718852.1 deoxyribonuclease IV [Pediococcus ethanolidurans]
MLLGSHVSMKAPKMFLGSVETAISYKANTFMIYTGAPQNTRRKPIDELRIPEGKQLMAENSLDNLIIHAPYIVNLGNTLKPESFQFGINFLRDEIKRADALGASQIVLHPGAHVGAGSDAAIDQIVKGLNKILSADQHVQIAIETMAGKGTEVGKNFTEIAAIIKGIQLQDKISVCFDTCHTNDAGYDVRDHFDDVLNEFDQKIGLSYLKVIHLNDSKNPRGSHKDRHADLGLGTIGFEALNKIAHYDQLKDVPKIMETPWIADPENIKKKYAPYGYEIAMLNAQKFNPSLVSDVLEQNAFDAFLK